MPLLKNNTLISDTWIHAGADGELPNAGDVIVPFCPYAEGMGKPVAARWQARRAARQCRSRRGALDVPAEAFRHHPALPLAFNDGRAYSIARQLREMGYRGELRATGNVLPDQLQLMLQVGFDTFDIGERFPLSTWQQASRQMSLAYQRGLFRRGSEAEIWTERHTDAEPWLEQPHAG